MSDANQVSFEKFKGIHAVITGGLGFLGSNLARRLVELGANVTLVDSLIPEYGGNLFNIAGIEDKVRVNISDVRDEHSLQYLMRGTDILFNLAGQTSHMDSMQQPQTDLEINCRSQLSILEVCRKYSPQVKVVFASTRQIYGKPDYLPVDEKHALRPVDVNGINKMAGEWYHILYNNVYGIRACALRLTNTIGPRMRVKDARQTFVGIWVRLLVEGKPFEVWDGPQRRDFTYADDCVDAFLAAAASEEANGKVFNLGGDCVVTLKELAETLIEINGGGEFTVKTFPADRKRIDIGDYFADFSAIRSTLGWTPRVSLKEGLKRTMAYYRTNLSQYLQGQDLREMLSPGGVMNRRTMNRILQANCEQSEINSMLLPANPKLNYAAHKAEIDAAVHAVLDGGWYVLGQQVKDFEAEFAAYVGVEHCLGVGSGTEAIHLALRACGIGPGDAVVTVSNTAVATVAAIELAGATPILVDFDPATYVIDPNRLADVLKSSPNKGRIKGVIPVHLYGHPADMNAIMDLAGRYHLSVIEDCAQCHGATLNGRKTGTFGHVAAFSFYPTKNLGALGDGGGVVTHDAGLAERCRLLREYGWRERYVSELCGMNTRLDEIQAAILRVKLKYLDVENQRRRSIAAKYDRALAGTSIGLPRSAAGMMHVYHQYVVRTDRRDALREYLKSNDISTLILYPIPIHEQTAYKGRLELGSGGLPNTESLARQILSLPMHPQLTDSEVEKVINVILRFCAT